MKRISRLLKPWLWVCSAFLVGVVIGRRTCPVPQEQSITRIDTVRITQPVPVKVESFDGHFHEYSERVFLPEPSSPIILDTVLMHRPLNLQFQRKIYRDSLYSAQVSGYEANLDWIEVYPRETIKYITREVKSPGKHKKWGIGVHAGYGVSLRNGVPMMSPYVGVGISYNLIRF